MKGVTLEFVEGKIARRELELARDAAIARWRAVKIAQDDKRLHLFRIDPAARRFLRQARLDLHPIGQKFFDVKIARAEESVPLSVAQEINLDAVGAGRRFVGGLEIQLRETHRRQEQLAHLRLKIARIENFDLDRQSFELPLPRAALHDAADVHLVARPINAALGENERLQLIGRNILDSVGVEARKIERPIGARIGHEGDVVAEARDVRRPGVSRLGVGLPNEGKFTRPSAPLVPLASGIAVLAEDLHRDAGEWLALFDRKDKDVAGAVSVLLHQHADIGDENETTIAYVAIRPFLHRIPLSRANEKQAALASAVSWQPKMTGEIEGGIVRLKFVLEIDRLMLERDPRNVFLVELTEKFRVFEIAVGLGDEMIDLVRGDAGDFVFDLGDARAI